MTKKDFQKFLSPVRKAPQVHSSARPVGYSERTFYNSDKRMFTGIGKEIICQQQTPAADTNYKFSNDVDLSTTNNQYPANQFECTMETNKIRYYVQYGTATSGYAEVPVSVYDNRQYCSSWATAVTSAMSLTLSRWSTSNVNLSIQFLLDCDILGDPCIERPPLSAYEQFWRRYIPPTGNWREPGVGKVLTAPSRQLTQEMCDNYRACYPGQTSCKRNLVLTGICESGTSEYGACPIYFLYNWRWIKSHLAEVGAVTSSIIARAALFTYASGIYSSWNSNVNTADAWNTELTETPEMAGEDLRSDILGMLDITIIGWGQTRVNLTGAVENSMMRQRWWYVIPHLGTAYGLKCSELMEEMEKVGTDATKDVYDAYTTKDDIVLDVSFYKVDNTGATTTDTYYGFYFNFGNVKCGTPAITGHSYSYPYTDTDVGKERTGVIKFNRRFDDSNIESQAVGAVPYNFVPKPWRTPAPTWSQYTTPPTL